jgi:hypothetical protein
VGLGREVVGGEGEVVAGEGERGSALALTLVLKKVIDYLATNRRLFVYAYGDWRDRTFVVSCWQMIYQA